MKPDYLYYNANIYTLDPANPKAEALAVSSGRIVAAGTLDHVRALEGSSRAEAIDLKGATLLPGLNDSHTHLLWWAHTLQQINLVGVDNLEEIVERVRAKAEVTPPGMWLTGLGWDKNLWGVDFPTVEALDRAAPNHPVALTSKDGHLLWVNSQAIALCGVDRDTPVPAGGEITRDAKGNPNGVFKENAMELIDRHRNEPDAAADLEALRRALPLAHRNGLTGVHSVEGREGLIAFQRLHETGELQFRTTVLPYNTCAPGLIEQGLRQGFGDEMLRLGQIKFFLDGTLGSQTAAMFEPFLEPLGHEHADGDGCEAANTGIFRMAEDDFLAQARHCIENGFAVAVHVIGDRAAHLGLDVIEKVMREASQNNNLPPRARNRLEHVQLLKAADLPRLAQSGIIASVQPTHATTDRDTAECYWGMSRLTESGRGYAYKSMLLSGARLALGSDVPIEPIAPLNGIYAAVARKRPGENRPAWLPAERLSVEEAVRGFTQGASFAAGEENRRGTLAPGYLADFTALGQDIFNLPEDEILSTPVVMTVVDGKPVFANL
ncbi:MAG TPA: amidohydrolase [Chloroflexia bacterium]|nr:amidohydrolase [Chloroflexia bacterium]